jgi:hypothetical protein
MVIVNLISFSLAPIESRPYLIRSATPPPSCFFFVSRSLANENTILPPLVLLLSMHHDYVY